MVIERQTFSEAAHKQADNLGNSEEESSMGIRREGQRPPFGSEILIPEGKSMYNVLLNWDFPTAPPAVLLTPKRQIVNEEKYPELRCRTLSFPFGSRLLISATRFVSEPRQRFYNTPVWSLSVLARIVSGYYSSPNHEHATRTAAYFQSQSVECWLSESERHGTTRGAGQCLCGFRRQ
jgi:hypothetical protein